MYNSNNMENNDVKVTENITEIKTDLSERIIEKVKKESINGKKMAIIERYEKVLNFLKGVQIHSEEALNHIKKPLNDLETSLKYIPNEPLFNDVFPTELKEHILNYLCDKNAFVTASVCKDWKKTLENRFKDKEVIIEECSKCENNQCVTPEDLMKAATIDNMSGVHLVICRPVLEMNSKLISDALTSVSNFTITNHYNYDNGDVEILSNEQFEHLFESIEKGDKIMKEVKLVHVDLNDLNQERLAYCLVSKVEKLTLSISDSDERMLDVDQLTSQLQQDSTNLSLTHLTLQDFDFPSVNCYDFNIRNNRNNSASINLASALCNVPNLKLCGYILNENPTIERLMRNIINPFITSTMVKTLFITDFEDLYDFRYLNPQDLKTLVNKMANLELCGFFTFKQVQAVRFLPYVEVEVCWDESGDMESGDIYHLIKKGSSEMF